MTELILCVCLQVLIGVAEGAVWYRSAIFNNLDHYSPLDRTIEHYSPERDMEDYSLLEKAMEDFSLRDYSTFERTMEDYSTLERAMDNYPVLDYSSLEPYVDYLDLSRSLDDLARVASKSGKLINN